jgi:chemotaxis protein MotB
VAKIDVPEEEPEEGAPAWMATFSDLCTLLLTFFVLLLSFATMDAKSFRDLAGSVRDAFGVTRIDPGPFEASARRVVEVGTGMPPGTGRGIATAIVRPTRAQQEMADRLRAALQRKGLARQVSVNLTEHGVSLRISDRALFANGSADILDSARSMVRRLAEVAAEMQRPMRIEGHTDDRPIHTSRFRSNWELSAARAATVLEAFEADGRIQAPMSVAGYASTRPVGDNRTAEGRAQNRRVELAFDMSAAELAQERIEPAQRPRAHQAEGAGAAGEGSAAGTTGAAADPSDASSTAPASPRQQRRRQQSS